MKRQINFKFLAILICGVVLSATGIHFLHAFQVKRTASAFLRQAERAEEEGDLEKSIRYFGRYLVFKPNETQALAKYGFALEKRSRKFQKLELQKRLEPVFFILEQVLRLDSKRHDVRRLQVDVAMKLRQFPTAQNHLHALLKTFPHDAKLEARLGICAEATKRFGEALEAYDRAIQYDPTKLSYYQRLAYLLRGAFKEYLKNNPKAEVDKKWRKPDLAADKVMQAMIDKNKEDSEAYLVRAALYWLKYGKETKDALKKATEDVEKAQELAPDTSPVVLVAAHLARVKGDREEERRVLKRGQKKNPKDLATYLALIHLEAKAGELTKALEYAGLGLEKLPKQGELLLLQGDLLLQQGNTSEAKPVVAALEEMKYSPEVTGLLKARLLIQQGKRGEPAQILDNLRHKLIPGLPLTRDVHVLLGRCQEQLGNPDQAILAYRDAVKNDPTSIPARLGVASALHGMGRFAEAVSEYRQILKFKTAPLATRLLLAQALVYQNLRLGLKKRDWKEVKAELDRAARDLPDSPQVPIWQAETLLQEDPRPTMWAQQMQRAQELLKERCDARPDQVEIWIARANLAVRQNQPRKALDILTQAQEERPKLSGRPELRLARIRYLGRLPEKEALRKLAVVEKGMTKLSEAEQLRTLEALGEAYYRRGSQIEAERIWKKLAEAQPDNLVIHLVLFDLAQEANHRARQTKKLDQQAQALARMEEITKVIRGIEAGPLKEEGIFWRYGEALVRLEKAVSEKTAERRESLLGEARDFLAEVAKRRPRWPRVAAVEGHIEEISGHNNLAIDRYQEAMTLGERRPWIVQRLVTLLIDAQRYVEAQLTISQLVDTDQTQTLLAAGLGKLATTALLRINELDQAFDVAMKSIPPKSKLYQDHLWLGQILWALGKPKAEEELRKACKEGPEHPETWIWLVSYLARNKQQTKAEKAEKTEKAMSEARTALAFEKVPKSEVALTMGHCYEAIGDLQRAETHFRAALAARPKDLKLLHNLAQFFLRNDQNDKAERYLGRILEKAKAPEDELVWARRNLARIMAGTADQRRFAKALKLLEANMTIDSPKEKEKDLRVRALLLATRTNGRKEAMRLFEDFSRQGSLSADERFALVQLYEADDNWEKAQTQIHALLGSEEGKKPVYMAYYIRRLLRKGALATADHWLGELEKQQPEAFRTGELKARLLAAQGKDQEAVDLLSKYVETAGKKANLGFLALVYDDLGQTAEAKELYIKKAEETYQLYVKEDKKPGSLLAFASFLGRHKRTGEALDLCEEALQKGPAEAVLGIAVTVLRAGEGGRDQQQRVQRRDQQQRVQRWFHQVRQKTPRSTALQFTLGDFYDLQGCYAEAIEVYRQIVGRNERHILARNNLAWLLALKEGNPGQALNVITPAIRLVGGSPELLDTRAVIYLAMGKSNSKQAVNDMESCLAQSPTRSDSRASRRFHLAQAYWLDEKPELARKALRLAEADGLKESMLHPLERPAYQRLLVLVGKR